MGFQYKKSAYLRWYLWQGLDQAGNEKEGMIEAISTGAAKLILRQQGILCQTMHRQYFILWNKGLKQVDIALFFQQLATIFQAGVPLLQALDTLLVANRTAGMRALIRSLIEHIESGHTFAESLSYHANCIDAISIHLVDAGEKSGTLDRMLYKIAQYKNNTELLKKKVKQSLTYPSIVLIMTCIVMTGLSYCIIPQFESLYVSFGAKLPLLTQVTLFFSNLVRHTAAFFMLGCWGAIFVIGYFHTHKASFRLATDTLLIKLPLIGPILQKSYVARFTSTLSITYAAGLPLLDALNLLTHCIGNQLFANALFLIQENVARGQTLHRAMEETALFPPMVIQMFLLGEETGTLEKMLNHMTKIYEEAVHNDVELLTNLLEPCIMTILGIMIGVLVIGIYLPIFKLGAIS